jgi:hypothetical protein
VTGVFGELGIATGKSRRPWCEAVGPARDLAKAEGRALGCGTTLLLAAEPDDPQRAGRPMAALTDNIVSQVEE